MIQRTLALGVLLLALATAAAHAGGAPGVNRAYMNTSASACDDFWKLVRPADKRAQLW